MSALDKVKFATDGWRLLESSDRERMWGNARGDELGVMWAPDSHMEIEPEAIDELRAVWRAVALEAGGALVEAELAVLDGGQGLRTILKLPQEPSGMTYVGGLAIPLRRGHVAIKVRCEELGTTGMRETSVWLRLGVPAGPDEDDPMKGWMRDPYDPNYRAPLLPNQADDTRWDAEFPDHPLSLMRAALRGIEATCRIDPGIRPLRQ